MVSKVEWFKYEKLKTKGVPLGYVEFSCVWGETIPARAPPSAPPVSGRCHSFQHNTTNSNTEKKIWIWVTFRQSFLLSFLSLMVKGYCSLGDQCAVTHCTVAEDIIVLKRFVPYSICCVIELTFFLQGLCWNIYFNKYWDWLILVQLVFN